MLRSICLILFAFYSVDSHAFDFSSKKSIQTACEDFAEAALVVYDGLDYWYYGHKKDPKKVLDEFRDLAVSLSNDSR